MSVSIEQKKLKEIVKTILLIDEQTRNDNDRLYLAVLTMLSADKGINLHNISVPSFYITRKQNGFPAYESVTRARRKAMEEDETLRADAQVEGFRALRDEEYREWATRLS